MTTTNSTTQPPHQDRGEECDICHGSGEGGGVDGDCAQCHGIGFNYHPTNSYERVRYARVIVDHVANGELGVDALHRVHDLLTAALTEAKQQGPGEAVWRCFYCNEVFTDQEAAALHFGSGGAFDHRDPACQINIAKYREMEALVGRYQEEDADIHRSMHRKAGHVVHYFAHGEYRWRTK